jgi:hypothetical protein
MKRVLTTKELEVPVGAMIHVADLLIENEISHVLVGTDEDNDTVTIEVEYGTDEREAIHAIEDAIDDNTAESTDDDDDDNDQEEDQEEDDHK